TWPRRWPTSCRSHAVRSTRSSGTSRSTSARERSAPGSRMAIGRSVSDSSWPWRRPEPGTARSWYTRNAVPIHPRGRRRRSRAPVPSRVGVGIEDVVGAVLSRMKGPLAGRQVETVYRPDLPAVPLDPTQMDQVLTNVLENAARFSPPGSEIRISAATWQTWLEVRISDRGPGIPAERREAVFEEFFREDRGSGRGGTGLGLSIARAIVQAHGGRIWIE